MASTRSRETSSAAPVEPPCPSEVPDHLPSGESTLAQGTPRLPSSLLRVAGLEEARYSACRTGDDEHGPDLEENVDDSSWNAERIFDLRRDRQELHRHTTRRTAGARTPRSRRRARG